MVRGSVIEKRVYTDGDETLVGEHQVKVDPSERDSLELSHIRDRRRSCQLEWTS